MFDPFTAGASIINAGIGYFGQQETNKMQAQMMQQQQSFQERMSNSAYQRASADMTAAGLNPMMMFSSGSAASTPAGASPSPSVKSGLDADAVQKAVSTAVQSRVANATIDNLVEQNAKIKAETLTEKQRPILVQAQTGTEIAREGATRAQEFETIHSGMNKEALRPVIIDEAISAKHRSGIPATARKVLDVGAFGGGAVGKTIAPITDIISSAKGVRSIFQDRFHY